MKPDYDRMLADMIAGMPGQGVTPRRRSIAFAVFLLAVVFIGLFVV